MEFDLNKDQKPYENLARKFKDPMIRQELEEKLNQSEKKLAEIQDLEHNI